jgi:hypothetical protein
MVALHPSWNGPLESPFWILYSARRRCACYFAIFSFRVRDYFHNIRIMVLKKPRAGMSFEDGAMLGECLSRIISKALAEKQMARRVYEYCRKGRTEMVVQRGNLQQYLYHLPDGPAQEERGRRSRMVPTLAVEALAWRAPT